MPMLDTIVFDLDGLMVDTEPLSRRAWETVLARYDQALPEALYRAVLGLRIEDTAARILAELPLPIQAPELVAQKSAAMVALVDQDLRPMPGLDLLLAQAAERRLPWGVATSSRRQHAQHILTRLRLWHRCRALAAGDEVEHGKPAPDVYLLAARRLGVHPAQCLALEDSLTGARAARAAGMVTVRIAADPDGDPSDSVAHFRFSSLAEAATNIDRLLASGRAGR